MTYADTSFMSGLIMPDAMSRQVMSKYFALGRPMLPYSPAHVLELPNALRANHFSQALQLPEKLRFQAELNRLQAESRLALFIKRGSFLEVHADWEAVTSRFAALSERYTPKLGCRTLDILHVAFAIELHCKHFITCDVRQSALAKAAGLKVTLVSV
ncbi:MAG: hypothetical protein JWO94_1604 [Verrucomicrobiaceae bacterium]|nr:hypothetical protein [Verrucomicrobiaceae bacterium]